MEWGFIDIGLILIILYLCYKLLVLSFNRIKGRLLLRVVSIFILFHIVILPIIYTSLINENPDSIEIDDKIIRAERQIILSEVEATFDVEFSLQKAIIEKIIRDNKDSIKGVTLGNITNNRLLILNEHIISSHAVQEIPSREFFYEVFIFDKNGNHIIEFISLDEHKTIKSVLDDYVSELTSGENRKAQKLNRIYENSFWSYRRILPYTLNILFTDNFNPKSQGANLVYFIHNIFVLGFLLSFIMTLLQNLITKNGNSN